MWRLEAWLHFRRSPRSSHTNHTAELAGLIWREASAILSASFEAGDASAGAIQIVKPLLSSSLVKQNLVVGPYKEIKNNRPQACNANANTKWTRLEARLLMRYFVYCASAAYSRKRYLCRCTKFTVLRREEAVALQKLEIQCGSFLSFVPSLPRTIRYYSIWLSRFLILKCSYKSHSWSSCCGEISE